MNIVHLSRIDLNLFVVFDTVFAEGSITRAGERLSLSQSAVSHALGRLRDLLGDPLFVREGQRMIPTAEARRIVEPLRQSLSGFEAALTEAKRFEPSVAAARFTIGVRDAMEPMVLPALAARVSDSAPRVRLSVVRAERRDLEKELLAGTLDLALDVMLPLPEEVRRERLASDPLVVMVRPDLPSVRSRLSVDAYLALDHVAVSSRRRGLSAEDFELARHGLRRRVALRCQSYLAACRVVSLSDFALTMPARHARILNASSGNRILPFPVETPAFETFLYWHRDAEDDPANAWLREQVRQAMGDVDGRAPGARPAAPVRQVRGASPRQRQSESSSSSRLRTNSRGRRS